MKPQYAVRRVEDRIDMKVTALLVGKAENLGVETGITEDVSSRGARILTASPWPVGETILVAIPGFHFTAAARVAYCLPLEDGRFGVGLEFVVASEPLEITALATALHFSHTNTRVA
jgi:PilZ domain